MWSEVQDSLLAHLKENPAIGERVAELERAASEGHISAARAAEQLMAIYLGHKR
jgi:hypothetical protein